MDRREFVSGIVGLLPVLATNPIRALAPKKRGELAIIEQPTRIMTVDQFLRDKASGLTRVTLETAGAGGDTYRFVGIATRWSMNIDRAVRELGLGEPGFEFDGMRHSVLYPDYSAECDITLVVNGEVTMDRR